MKHLVPTAYARATAENIKQIRQQLKDLEPLRGEKKGNNSAIDSKLYFESQNHAKVVETDNQNTFRRAEFDPIVGNTSYFTNDML